MINEIIWLYGLSWQEESSWICEVNSKICVYLVPGGRLNIKMLSYQYRDSHVKDKTVSRPSYL